jgi:cysteine synthase A
MTPARTIEALEAPYTPSASKIDFAALEARYPAYAAFGRELGKTPLLAVPGPRSGAAIVAKCEWHNPEGSVKDRVAYALVGNALQAHGERPLSELRLLEYSGGGLSRALSRLCSDLGLHAWFFLSSASPRSLLDTLAERGARVDLVPKEKGFLEVVRSTLRAAEAHPEWTLLYQHRNAANLEFHRSTTGAEVLHDMAGRHIDAWVASIGTGGTLVGVLQALSARHPRIRAIGVTPAELPYASPEPPNGLPKYAGSGGMGHGIRQPFVTLRDQDIEHRSISYPQALEAMAEFHGLTGIKIGSSAAANWLVAKEIAGALPPSSTVATIFPDAGNPEEWERIS